MCRRASNQPAAGKAGIARQLTIEHHWPGLPEPGRRPLDTHMRRFAKTTILAGIPFGLAMGVFYVLRVGWSRGLLLASGSGLLFGIAMAAFSTYQRRRFTVERPAFADERVLHEGPANHFLNREGVGGWIYLTTRRLLFRSHAINFQPHELSIELSDISEAMPVLTAKFIPNGLRIVTHSGRDERFVVEERRRWCDEIKRARTQSA